MLTDPPRLDHPPASPNARAASDPPRTNAAHPQRLRRLQRAAGLILAACALPFTLHARASSAHADEPVAPTPTPTPTPARALDDAAAHLNALARQGLDTSALTGVCGGIELARVRAAAEATLATLARAGDDLDQTQASRVPLIRGRALALRAVAHADEPTRLESARAARASLESFATAATAPEALRRVTLARVLTLLARAQPPDAPARAADLDEARDLLDAVLELPPGPDPLRQAPWSVLREALAARALLDESAAPRLRDDVLAARARAALTPDSAAWDELLVAETLARARLGDALARDARPDDASLAAALGPLLALAPPLRSTEAAPDSLRALTRRRLAGALERAGARPVATAPDAAPAWALARWADGVLAAPISAGEPEDRLHALDAALALRTLAALGGVPDDHDAPGALGAPGAPGAIIPPASDEALRADAAFRWAAARAALTPPHAPPDDRATADAGRWLRVARAFPADPQTPAALRHALGLVAGPPLSAADVADPKTLLPDAGSGAGRRLELERDLLDELDRLALPAALGARDDAAIGPGERAAWRLRRATLAALGLGERPGERLEAASAPLRAMMIVGELDADAPDARVPATVSAAARALIRAAHARALTLSDAATPTAAGLAAAQAAVAWALPRNDPALPEWTRRLSARLASATPPADRGDARAAAGQAAGGAAAIDALAQTLRHAGRSDLADDPALALDAGDALARAGDAPGAFARWRDLAQRLDQPTPGNSAAPNAPAAPPSPRPPAFWDAWARMLDALADPAANLTPGDRAEQVRLRLRQLELIDPALGGEASARRLREALARAQRGTP